jgi:hypothetical protein
MSVLPSSNGADAHCNLGRAGAKGDDGEPDDERADTEGHRQFGRTAHQSVGADDQQDQAAEKHEKVHDRLPEL